MSLRNVCSHAATTRSFKFMILIMFESRDKTCSKIEKKLVSTSSLGGKKQ